MRGYFGRKTALVAALLTTTSMAQAEDVEVLHWWTSGGEAAALNVLKEDLATKSIGWVDMPVAGGGGEAAMTALRARVTAGDPPTAVQMLGFDILDWAGEGASGGPVRGRRCGRLGRGGSDRTAGLLEIGRQVDRGPGQRPLDQLGLDQQGST